MDEDADWVTIEADWGTYRVQSGSLLAMSLDPRRIERERVERIERGEMSWSLGSEFADLLWMLVPEARSILVGLATKELDEALRYNRFLEPVMYAALADALYLELLLPATQDISNQRDVVRRCLAVMRRVIVEADGDFRWETLDRNILRMLESDGWGDVLTEVDPEFMAFVRQNRLARGQS